MKIDYEKIGRAVAWWSSYSSNGFTKETLGNLRVRLTDILDEYEETLKPTDENYGQYVWAWNDDESKKVKGMLIGVDNGDKQKYMVRFYEDKPRGWDWAFLENAILIDDE